MTPLYVLALLAALFLAWIAPRLPATATAGASRVPGLRQKSHCALPAMVMLVVAFAISAGPALPAMASDGENTGGGTLSVYFLDVGQGDSELLVLPDGRTMLIDAGAAEAGPSVVSFIQSLGCSRIDFLVATHPHEDHIGGMPDIFDAFEIGQVWAPEVAHDTQAFEEFLNAVEAEGLTIDPALAGSRIYDFGGCTVDILSPASGASHEDLNDWSTVLKVSYGANSWLLTGDASASVLEQLGVGHVDMLKVAHHGSDTGTTPTLLSQLTPAIAVIPVGAGNSYGHPTQETVDELVAAGTQLWRTDLDGTVLSVSDGSSMTNSAVGTGATAPAPSQQTDAAQAAIQAAAAGQAATAEQTAAGQAAAEQAVDPSSQAVYVTETGEKYHRDGCRHLKSRIETTLGAVIAQGYEPCKVCDPPTL